MSIIKDAAGYRTFYRDVSTTATRTAAQGDLTLITVRSANHTIYVQRIVAYITTDAAQSWSFEDDAGTPKKIAEVSSSPGDETRWEFPFGDAGVPLTAGQSLVLNASAAGLAGHIEVEAYEKLTGVVAAASTN